MRTRSALPTLLVSTVLGCSFDQSPSTAPDADNRSNLAISDGRHGAGNAHFFFLPPLVPQPSATGAFDGTLSPVVEVCEWAGSCGAITARFTMQSGTGGATVGVDLAAKQYHVKWDTKVCVSGPCALDPAKTYRLRVLVAGTQLGFADMDVVANGSQLKNVQTSDYIGLVDGRTLPVKFRIETGAVAVVGAAGGTANLLDGDVTLNIPPGAIGADIGITANPGPVPVGTSAARLVDGSVLELGPDGTQFAEPVTVSIKYDPADLPAGRPESSLRLYARVNGAWDLVPGSSVDLASHSVSGAITHFSEYSIQSMRRIALSLYDGALREYLIHLINEDGETGLTLFRRDARSLSWSPDGLEVAFHCVKNCPPLFDLCGDDLTCSENSLLVRTLSTGQERIVVGGRLPPVVSSRSSWAPDGTRIVLGSDGGGWIAFADGSLPQVVVASPGGYTCCHTLSPSGEWISFSFIGATSWEQWLVRSDGSTAMHKVSDGPPGLIEWSEGWTRDGTKLVLGQTESIPQYSTYSIATYDIANGQTDVLLTGLISEPGTHYDLDFGVTPDGSKVSFFAFGTASDNRVHGCIWTVDLITRVLRCVVDGAVINAANPNWSLMMIEGWEP